MSGNRSPGADGTMTMRDDSQRTPVTDEPGPGARVVDSADRVWINTAFDDPYRPGACNWELEEAIRRGEFEPESWIRVCQFGPVFETDTRKK